MTRHWLTDPEMPSGLAPAAIEHELRKRVPPTSNSSIWRTTGQCSYHAGCAVHAHLAPEESLGHRSELLVQQRSETEGAQVPLDGLEYENEYALIEYARVAGLSSLARRIWSESPDGTHLGGCGSFGKDSDI